MVDETNRATVKKLWSKTPRPEILVFDDGLENVQGAKNVGWKAHLYTDFKNFEKVVEKNIL